MCRNPRNRELQNGKQILLLLMNQKKGRKKNVQNKIIQNKIDLFVYSIWSIFWSENLGNVSQYVHMLDAKITNNNEKLFLLNTNKCLAT